MTVTVGSRVVKGDIGACPRRRGKIFLDQLIWICYYWLWHSNEILVSRLLTHYTRTASL